MAFAPRYPCPTMAQVTHDARSFARTRRGVAALLVLAGAASLAVLPGCVGYNDIEPIDGGHGFVDPNSPPVPTAMATALRWVVDRYPPTTEGFTGFTTEAPLAVSFPLRTRREIGDLVFTQAQIKNATFLTPATESLPIYRIGRVYVRGDEATVDIHRPVPTLARDKSGTPYYQTITVNMRAGLSPWRVTSHRVWPVGSIDLPLVNYMTSGKAGSSPTPEAQTPESVPATTPATPEPTTSDVSGG